MFEQNAQTATRITPAAEAVQHRCLNCLRGGDPEKRACAARRMLAEGFPAEQVERLRCAPQRPQ